MANVTGVRITASTLFQSHLDNKLVNVQFKRMPFLAMLGIKNGDKQGIFDLGRPTADTPSRGLVISGNPNTVARKAEIFGSFVFEPIVTAGTRPNPTVTLSTTLGNQPQVENWADNQFFADLVRPRVRWVRYSTPFSISKDYMDFMKQKAGGDSTEGGWTAISSLQLSEITTRTAQHCKSIDDDIHTGGGPSNTTPGDAQYWDAPFSIKKSLDTTSTYLDIDRTVGGNEFWQGNTITAATQLNLRAMIDYVNYDASGPKLADFGLGIDSLLMGGALYAKALREAEARGPRVTISDIPELGKFGLKQYAAMVDNKITIIHDPTMPANEVAGINWSTWTLALHPTARFSVNGPNDQTVMAGGPRAMTGTIDTLIMLFCEWPKSNAYWTSVS